MVDVFLPRQPRDLSGVSAVARLAETAGCGRLWLAHSLVLEAHHVVAALSQRFARLHFGTAVSLMAVRHALQAAVEARSLSAITDGRFALGLGVSEPATVEGVLGGTWHPPVEQAREYLAAVRGLVAGKPVQSSGRCVRVDARLPDVVASAPPVLLGALGPRMARVAGACADGCLTWLAPAAYLANVVVPAVEGGAAAAGRPAPPVTALVPVAPTADVTDAGRIAEQAFGIHVRRPHYRRMLERAGLAPGPDITPEIRDAVLAWGDPEALGARLRAYRDAGADRVGMAVYPAGATAVAAFDAAFDIALRVLDPAPRADAA